MNNTGYGKEEGIDKYKKKQTLQLLQQIQTIKTECDKSNVESYTDINID